MIRHRNRLMGAAACLLLAASCGGAAPEAAPGLAIVRMDATGSGACTGRSLADVIAEVHRGWPQLADIQKLRDPDRIGDGSFIYAFAQPPGFALAFKRGGGDCPAGCTENEYWYFATDDRCQVQPVGHYRAAWSTQNCLQVIGAPLWDTPRGSDPAVICDAD